MGAARRAGDVGGARAGGWGRRQALKKALYKPAAFYKGVVLPLCESGTCTLREATVLSSVIKKVGRRGHMGEGT